MPKKHKARKGSDGVVGGKKRCRKCGKRKPVAKFFYKDKDTPDGYRSYCKGCEQGMNAKYQKAAAKVPNSKKNKGGKGGKGRVGSGVFAGVQ